MSFLRFFPKSRHRVENALKRERLALVPLFSFIFHQVHDRRERLKCDIYTQSFWPGAQNGPALTPLPPAPSSTTSATDATAKASHAPNTTTPIRHATATAGHARRDRSVHPRIPRGIAFARVFAERTITPSPSFSAENELAAEQPRARATTTSPRQSNSRRSRPPKHLPIARGNLHPSRIVDPRTNDRSVDRRE